jgi:hypothetical protein
MNTVFKLLIICLLSLHVKAQNANDVPNQIMSPVFGNIVYTDGSANCRSFNSNTWGFCQHKSGFHKNLVSLGIDDTFAWDCNRSNEDEGDEVYPVEDGIIVNSGWWAGNDYGQLLIRHNTDGKEWYSGYLHMTNITNKKSIGATVTKEEVIGKVGSVNATNPHLHFAVYYKNLNGKYLSVDRAFQEKTLIKPFMPEMLLIPKIFKLFLKLLIGQQI